jgi:hypothetical protein
MKVKTSTLKDRALDWAVAQLQGKKHGYAEHLLEIADLDLVQGFGHSMIQRYSPSTNWLQGGPILSRQRINREFNHNSGLWQAFRGQGVMHTQQDSSELVAGMRCFVASHYGEEVEVPDELV